MRSIRGVGLGLRWEFLPELLSLLTARNASEASARGIDFLEVSPENYFDRGGYESDALDYLAGEFPILTHGLTMSLGGVDALDENYLAHLAAFIKRVGSPWHSDHLCFGNVGPRIMHELLPIALKRSAVSRVADRIKRAEDRLGVPMAIENVSFYLHPGEAEMSEAEFIARVCEAADCRLMLDVNNAYVNSKNFGLDVDEWFRAVPLDRVVQIHVAGHDWFDLEREPGAAHESGDRLILDTHGQPVCDPVLELLEKILTRVGPVPVVLERDINIPPLATLLAELDVIRAIYDRALGG